MVVPTMWIRNNMLFSPEQYGRQLTEAELKVQRSLQKLSVPDWYLNRRSNLPKIVNASPIEKRPPSWKCPTPENLTNNSICSDLSDAYVTNVSPKTPKKNDKSTNNGASRQQKSPEFKYRNSPRPKEEIFDTWLPEVQLPTNVSKTFPKVSPSRKIKNINLVLPPGPNLDDEIISSNCDIFFTKKQSSPKNSPPRKKENNVKEIVQTPVKSSVTNGGFRLRTSSSPRFTPAQIFSSTVIEDNPRPKKKVSPNILEKSFIFENRDTSESFSDICQTPKELSQNLLEKTFDLDGSRADQSFRTFDDSSVNIGRDSRIFEKNIYSIEPIFFEKDDTALSTSRSSSMVRDIVKKLEMSNNSFQTPHKISTLTWKKPTSKKSNFELKLPSMFYEKRFDLAPKSPVHLLRQEKPSPSTQSPCTRFLSSVRKSTDLENMVRSKQKNKEKGVVRGIIESLAEKVNQSTLPRQKQVAHINQSFVRKVVTALENVDRLRTANVSRNRRISMNEDTESSSESEFKSNTTSVSVKDTDSSSDSDQRTPSLRSDNDGTFNFGTLTTTNVYQEDDSVYWIPVSKCKLPRSSSLLSMMSKLSENGHSPCLSPIRADSEVEYQPTWDLVYRRTRLSRKLFRIDETVVIDSGYSDKSDRSGISSRFSMEDSSVGP